MSTLRLSEDQRLSNLEDNDNNDEHKTNTNHNNNNGSADEDLDSEEKEDNVKPSRMHRRRDLEAALVVP